MPLSWASWGVLEIHGNHREIADVTLQLYRKHVVTVPFCSEVVWSTEVSRDLRLMYIVWGFTAVIYR